MKKIILVALILFAELAFGSDLYDSASGLLTIPNVAVNGTQSCYSLTMQQNQDSTFSISSSPLLTNCQSSTSIYQISTFKGTYEGVSKGGIFSTDNTTITISISSPTLTLTVASFFGGTCKYLGSISNDGVSITNGTYQCADFTSGTWTLQKMMLVETTNIYISLLRGDGLVKSMIGMKVSN